MKKQGMSEIDIQTALESLKSTLKKSDTCSSQVSQAGEDDDKPDKEDKSDLGEKEATYEIDDLLEKPRSQSVPRQVYSMESEEFFTDFDIKEYYYKLQSYLREKNKILHDDEYRAELLKRKKLEEENRAWDSVRQEVTSCKKDGCKCCLIRSLQNHEKNVKV